MRETQIKGPKNIRVLILALTLLLGILVYWLLGFLINDIGQQTGPDLIQLQQKYQNPSLISQKETLNKRYASLLLHIDQQKQQQLILQNSIKNYQDTINQLLALQKDKVENNTHTPSDTKPNLKKITDAYLNYQLQFQDLNQSISKDNLDTQTIQTQITDIDKHLSPSAKQAYLEYQSQLMRHNFAIACMQLLLLIPLLIISGYLFIKYRSSIYKPLISAFGIAVLLKTALTMHEHFPSNVFKYILILVLIYFTIQSLLFMLRMIANPKQNWLIKRYKEAYQKQECPICQFPIKPGILKFIPDKNHHRTYTVSDVDYFKCIEKYTCPGCGESLFEQCHVCAHVRHSLLVFCDTCGAERCKNDKTQQA